MPEPTPPDFQRKLDEFNDSQGPGVKVDVCFDPKIKRWTVWAVPQGDTSHPKYNPRALRQLIRPFPDDSGRWGVKIFTWAESNERGEDTGPRALDDRIFQVLRVADSFRSREHFEEVFEEPEQRRAMETSKMIRDIAYGARSYWWGLDRPTVGARSRGDWRWRIH